MTSATYTSTADGAPNAMGHPMVRAASIGVAFLPKLGCPLCWPVLAGLCGLAGLQFVYLNRVIVASTALYVVGVVILTIKRRRITPYAVLAIGSLLTLIAYRICLLPAWVGYAGSTGLLLSLGWSFVTGRTITCPSRCFRAIKTST